MTEAVVDRFEPVDVEEDDGQFATITTRAFDLAPQPPVESRAIGQRGHRVAFGLFGPSERAPFDQAPNLSRQQFIQFRAQSRLKFDQLFLAHPTGVTTNGVIRRQAYGGGFAKDRLDLFVGCRVFFVIRRGAERAQDSFDLFMQYLRNRLRHRNVFRNVKKLIFNGMVSVWIVADRRNYSLKKGVVTLLNRTYRSYKSYRSDSRCHHVLRGNT